MKVIRTAVLVAAASAAVSKAKEYARENPAKASETIDKAEAFVREKAGPKYADKVGKGSSALRRSLGLTTGSSASATTSDVSSPTSTAGGSTPSSASTTGGSASATSRGFDPSI
jgi:hypothetical protein